MKRRRLQELDRSDFEIVKDEPDIRGWDVKNNMGEKIGDVEELIVDARDKKVRYMVVDLDDNKLKLDHRKILLPIGLAELDERHDDVLVPNVNVDQLNRLPDYDRNHLTADVEKNVCSILGRKNGEYDYSAGAAALEQDETLRREEKEEERQEEKRMRAERERMEYAKNERKESGRRGKEVEDEEEVDPDFYRHEYYNLDNLYKNRLHKIKPVEKKQPDYIIGLTLWERISEGGIVPGENQSDRMRSESTSRNRDMDDEQRMQMIRERRRNYEQRRYGDDYDRREKNDLNDERKRRERSDDY